MTKIKNWLVNNKYVVLVCFGMFFVPIAGAIPIRIGDIWYVHYLALFSIFCLGISTVLWKFNRFISLFTVLCWMSTILVANQHPRSMLSLIQIDLACLAMYGMSLLNQRQRKIVLRSIVGLTIVQGIWVVVQFLNIDPIFNHIKDANLDDTVGFSGSHNQIGLFFAVTSPLILAYAPYLLILNIIGLFGGTTTMAWCGFVVGCSVFLYYKSRYAYQIQQRNIICFALITLLTSIMFFSKFENLNSMVIRERYQLMAHSIVQVHNGKAMMERGIQMREIYCNRWFGYGLGNFIRISPWTQERYISNMKGRAFERAQHHRYAHAHNDLVEVLFEMGWTGFVVMVLAIVDFILGFIRSKKTETLVICFCCVLAHLVCAMGIFTVHTAVSAMMLILFYSLYVGELREISNGTNP